MQAAVTEPTEPTGECANTGCPDGCYWASKTRGGVGLWVPQCKICGNIDWDGISEQLVTIRGQAAYAAEESRVRVAQALVRVEEALVATREKLGIASAKATYQRQDFDRTLHEVMQAASVVIERHANMIEQAYGIIACAWNVGDPPVEPVPGWNAAVFEFQERYHAWLKGRISS